MIVFAARHFLFFLATSLVIIFMSIQENFTTRLLLLIPIFVLYELSIVFYGLDYDKIFLELRKEKKKAKRRRKRRRTVS